MITVVNKHTHKPTLNDMYIGRGNVLGNPYTHLKSKTTASFVVSSREEAVKRYKIKLYKILQDNDNKDYKLFKIELQRIKNVAEKGDVNLVCFCAPLSCHGDVIKEIIEQYIKEGKNFI